MSNKKDNALSAIETIIGANTELKGSLKCNNSIRIDGKVEGETIEADGIIIGENGSVKGNIKARIVVIGGKVAGDIHAVHNIEIQSKAEMRGNLISAVLSIAEGAIIEGSCVALSDQNKVIEFGVENK